MQEIFGTYKGYFKIMQMQVTVFLDLHNLFSPYFPCVSVDIATYLWLKK
jgi:hypothetical protein